jgi:tetratricopeptide (TPR) repeat protein
MIRAIWISHRRREKHTHAQSASTGMKRWCPKALARSANPVRLTVRLGALILALAALLACSSPQARETKFLERGKKYFGAKDFVRAALEFQNAMKAKPDDAEAHFQLALAYLALANVNGAVESLREATWLNPKHIQARLKLAELMARNGDQSVVREGEKLAKSALDISPDNADALSTLALAELRLGEVEDAEEHVLEALKKFPHHLKSTLTLAAVKLQVKDWPGAEEILRKAEAEAPDSAEPPLALGRFYVMRGEPAEAEEQFNRAIHIDPKSGTALSELAALQVRSGLREKAEQTYNQLSALPDKQFRSAHAMFLFQDGQRDPAIAELEKLLKEDPDDRVVRARLLMAYLAVNRIPEGEKVLAAALKQHPKDPDTLLQRAEFYFSAGKYSEAQKDLNQLPKSAVAHFLLSKVHKDRGDLALRRQELTATLRLDPDMLEARIELAQALLTANSAKAALDLMNEAPENQSRQLRAIIQRNWVLYDLKNDVELRKGIEQGLAIARSSDLLLQEALLRQRQGERSAALDAWKEALQRDPQNLQAVASLAESYAAQGQTAQGLETVRKYASERPNSPPMQLLLGEWLLRTGDRVGARAAFSSAKSADPKFGAADLQLAQLDIADGKLDAARQMLLGDISSNDPNAARLLLGLVEHKAGNHQAAIEQYRKVLETDPNNLLVLNNLAYWLAVDSHQPDEALKFAQQAEEIAPADPNVEDTLGWVLYQKGIYQTAVVHLEEAVSKAERNPVTRYHLAMAYLKTGDLEHGQHALDAALRMAPKLPEANMANAVLREVEQTAKRQSTSIK